MKSCSLHSIILDARTNLNKTFSDLIWDHFYCYNVSGKEEEEKLKELIYDARQDREFDYISKAERNEILDRKIVLVGEIQHFDQKYKRLGFTGKKTLEVGYVYSPYIPLIRGEFPKFVAEDLVSVQPMSAPAMDWVPEVELTLKSKTIVSKPRKLKCKWSMEQSTSFEIPNEKKILASWASDVRHEIDKEIIDGLKTFVERANRNSAAMNYSKKTINKNFYKAIGNPFLETSTLKANNMLNKSMSESMDESLDDFLKEQSRQFEMFTMPKIAPVEIPF